MTLKRNLPCLSVVQSYLNVTNLLAAAVSRNAGAIHPGYGFLSENANFVHMCTAHNIEFIGPLPEQINIMGDKATARKTMMDANVPCVPGSAGLISTEAEALQVRCLASLADDLLALPRQALNRLGQTWYLSWHFWTALWCR
jgi:acetyl/propionyl-CoA carboxylase alpha subunit